MRFDELLTDDAVLAELGRRLRRYRLGRNLTQDQLAELAGIGRATLQRIERGQSAQSTALVKLLRALGLQADLEALLPEDVEFPIAELERRRRGKGRRVRARHAGRGAGRGAGPAAGEREAGWRWGDTAGEQR
jgi:transcriptional regulator with XRE-family HTH domain